LLIEKKRSRRVIARTERFLKGGLGRRREFLWSVVFVGRVGLVVDARGRLLCGTVRRGCGRVWIAMDRDFGFVGLVGLV
jgi:hypothetical protein